MSQRPRSAADTYHVITFIRDGARRAPIFMTAPSRAINDGNYLIETKSVAIEKAAERTRNPVDSRFPYAPQKHNATERNMIARRRRYFHGRLPQNASNRELTTFKESVSVINITGLTILSASLFRLSPSFSRRLYHADLRSYMRIRAKHC